MPSKKPNGASVYIAAAPPQARPMLKQLRAIVRAAAPGAIESISYGILYYRHHGRLVYVAAFKNHCSLFLGSRATLKKFAYELKPYKTSVGTLQFQLGTRLPVGLIKRLVRARVAENQRDTSLSMHLPRRPRRTG